jgi:hypothetical protein
MERLDNTSISLVLFTLIMVAYIAFRFAKVIREMVANPEFRVLLVTVIILLVVGANFYRRVEGWTMLDSLYFSLITLTTVGYGDISPVTNAGKIFTMFYTVIGLGILAAFITTVANIYIAHSQTRLKTGATDEADN